ncbi:myo-inositol 1-phosphate synthase [Gracilaria domingensis]|nr:myo-inositol 1-phosphate synthase [Gracilaria domingensis]
MTDNTEQRKRIVSRVAGAITASGKLTVNSSQVSFDEDFIHSRFPYNTVKAVLDEAGNVLATPTERVYHFRTKTQPRKLGLLQVGWGGNNGTTVTAAVIANQNGITWETRNHAHVPNYNGSLTQAATLRIGFDEHGRDVFVPLKSVVPMANPNDIVLGGWDISGLNLADAMDRAGVLEPELRRKLRPYMENMKPLPAAFDKNFIAKNQIPRADNIMQTEDKQVHLDNLREDIRNFKKENDLEYVVVVWTGNSERYAVESEGRNDTADNLLASIKKSDAEVSPSTLYCVAAILEGCPYINGSPQNTFVAGATELAKRHDVLICGDDFKSGQTKMKSVLADYLIGCGVKIKTMVTYNHLGNNDMYQLTDEVMWKPKSASKSRVIEDIVDSNGTLYKGGDDVPDHVVVVKYVPFLGDSKRDVSEYTSETFMDCHYTTIMHNECLDSALCAPLILDLAIFAELFSRVEYGVEGANGSTKEMVYSGMESALSVLGFYMKIPRTPDGEPIVNALGRQKACIENMLRALVGLQPEHNMLLETKCPA